MANEIRTNYESGHTLYACIRRQSDGSVWYPVGAAFEAWGTSGRTAANYAITMTDKSGSLYMGDFPSGITAAASYDVQVFEQVGGAPADTDVWVGQGDLRWDGDSALDVWDAMVGPGELPVTVTIRTTSGTALDGVETLVSTTGSQSDALPPMKTTNDLGQVELYLDPNVTYYLHCSKSGYSFASASFTPTVSATSFTKDIASTVSGLVVTDYTLSYLQSWVQSRLPENYFSSILTTARLTQIINEVQRETCRRHNFMWMKRECTQNTIDGQQRYSLPDGTDQDANDVTLWRYKQDISVELIDHLSQHIPLTCGDKEMLEADIAWKDTSRGGTPSHYAIDHFDLWLYNWPDHTYNSGSAWVINMEYYGYLPELVSSDDTNFLTAHCPDVLKFGALSAAFEIGTDYDEAAYWKGKANDVFAELRQEDLAAQHGPIEIGLTPTHMQAVGYRPYRRTRIYTTGGYYDE